MENEKQAAMDDDALKRARQKRIGSHLRKLYDDVASEPVPDDFLALLDMADRKKNQSDES